MIENYKRRVRIRKPVVLFHQSGSRKAKTTLKKARHEGMSVAQKLL